MDAATQHAFGDLTESDVSLEAAAGSSAARLRNLTPEEYRERLLRPGLAPAEAKW